MPDLETLEGQLAEVDAAITAILTRGQTVVTDAVNTLGRADLGQLREMRKDLQRQIARKIRGGLAIYRAEPQG